MANSTKVAKHFSQVLERGRLDEVDFQDDTYILVRREQVEQGRLSSDDTEKLFTVHDEAAVRRSKKHADEAETESSDSSAVEKTASTAPTGRRESSGQQSEDAADVSRTLPVVISSVTLHPGHATGAGPAGLLLLSGVLRSDGRLEPDLETSPFTWIPAERLSTPKIADREVMVGSLANFWGYATKHLGADSTSIETFGDALKAADDLFTSVLGSSLETFAEVVGQAGNSVSIDYENCYIQEFNRIDAVAGLLEIYDYLGRRKTFPPLVERIIQGWNRERISENTIYSGAGLDTAARRSCGSMSDGFPLTDSQRRAVHAFLVNDSEGEITAVSGPPGTGKTTMLQSIAANIITSRALNRDDPPVIVGTSTNNQAVTNIISSFASVTKEEHGTLDFRWLPESADGVAGEAPMSSLSVYCPSKSKLDYAKKHHLVEQKDKSETYTAYSAETYIEQATERFLLHAHAYFGHIESLESMRETIHHELTDLDTSRLDLIEAMGKHGPASPQFQGLCDEVAKRPQWNAYAGVNSLRECENLESLDRALDTTLRYLQFWLSVHYFESLWLAAEFIPEEDRFKTTRSVMKAYWPQAAALTPCFVMTAYQVPKYFRPYVRNGEPAEFDIGRIDLLIVDEAGQVDTPIGLPAFALAKRAVVVGDEQQLAPIWSLDEVTDQQAAESAGIARREWANDLRRRGMTCSDPSSLMRAASHASRWSYAEENPGLFLSEHFRCHPQIIGYCNELLYDGLLKPMRQAEKSRLDVMTPAFVFAEVSGSEDRRQGSSRTNPEEATAIATWIVKNFMHFFAEYNEKVDNTNDKVPAAELIGVVTPFSAQARLIKQALAEAVDSAEEEEGLLPGLADLITIGTAHKLQGAERPIVLFSAVYGDNSGQSSFIDVNPQLMNVAVSRAKDLFLVFASHRRWGKGRVFQLMTRFASKSPIDFARRARDESVPHELMAIPPKPKEPPQAARPFGGRGDEEPAETTNAARQAMTITNVLKAWRDSGELRPPDSDINAGQFNKRLKAAGVLIGEPGSWSPSTLAGLLGVEVVDRKNSGGETYKAIEFSPHAQDLLLGLYRDSKL